MKMNKKTKLAIGTSLVAGLVTGCATTDNNTFGQKELSSGYMNQANSAKEQSMKKVKEGKCGNKKAAAMKKAAEGKCGEGTCGGSK